MSKLIRGLDPKQIEQSRTSYGANIEGKGDFTILKIFIFSIFSIYNLIISGLILILYFVGSYNDAFFLGMIGILNTAIGLIQEIRARFAIKDLNKLTKRTVRVVRVVDNANQIIEIPTESLVIDDIIFLEDGDRIPADGIIVETNSAEFDESIITGESDYVEKHVNDIVHAGSFISAGNCFYKMTKLSKNSYIQQIAKKAGKYTINITPIQKKINSLIRYLTYLTIALLVIVVILNVTQGTNKNELVRNFIAIITSLVPQGLVLITTVSFAYGAMKIAEYSGLIKHLSAVESMASVQVLCMDKTGTLTKNELTVREIIWLNTATQRDHILLNTFIHHLTQKNKTVQAIQGYLNNAPIDEKMVKRKEVPFSSERKFSVCVFNNVSLVMGAPEILLGKHHPLIKVVKDYSRKSYRVLAFGYHTNEIKKFTPLCLIVVEDIIRDDAFDTLRKLSKNDIEFKVISGDSTETVVAIAKKVNKDFKALPISGPGLEQLSKKEFTESVISHNVFARITPRQKQEIIKVLNKSKLYTAMIGDGANDVLAIKEANLGIAMNDGSSMTKDVADLVLLNNSFATLPVLLDEGKKIITNIQNIASIYLIKNISSILLVLIVGILNFGFPYDPKHIALSSFLIMGVPSFIIALEENIKQNLTNEHFFRKLMIFSIKVGVMNALILIGVFVLSNMKGDNIDYSRTFILATTLFLGILNIFIIYMRNNPIKEILKNKLLMGMILVILVDSILNLYVPVFRRFLSIEELKLTDLAISIAVSLIGFFIFLLIDKKLSLGNIFQKLIKDRR